MKRARVRTKDGEIVEGLWNEKFEYLDDGYVAVKINGKKVICFDSITSEIKTFGKEWQDDFGNIWHYVYRPDGTKEKELVKKGDKEYTTGKEWKDEFGNIWRYKYYQNGTKEKELVKEGDKDFIYGEEEKDKFGNIWRIKKFRKGGWEKELIKGVNIISNKIYYDDKTNKWMCEEKVGYDFLSLAKLDYMEETILPSDELNGGRWLFKTITREATEEEIKKELDNLHSKALNDFYNILWENLKNNIMQNGETWKKMKTINGEALFIKDKNSIIYGGGEWFIIEEDYIYYIQNNGRDGDDWSRNNVKTGGAGAIGFKIKITEEINNIIKKLQELEKIK